MKKTNKVIKDWKAQLNKPGNYVFNIQIDTKDFNEMIAEIEELQDEVEAWRDGRVVIEELE